MSNINNDTYHVVMQNGKFTNSSEFLSDSLFARAAAIVACLYVREANKASVNSSSTLVMITLLIRFGYQHPFPVSGSFLNTNLSITPNMKWNKLHLAFSKSCSH